VQLREHTCRPRRAGRRLVGHRRDAADGERVRAAQVVLPPGLTAELAGLPAHASATDPSGQILRLRSGAGVRLRVVRFAGVYRASRRQARLWATMEERFGRLPGSGALYEVTADARGRTRHRESADRGGSASASGPPPGQCARGRPRSGRGLSGPPGTTAAASCRPVTGLVRTLARGPATPRGPPHRRRAALRGHLQLAGALRRTHWGPHDASQR
jgi:hypothetical protein